MKILIITIILLLSFSLYSQGWEIEGDKGAHFTLFCGAYIMAHWTLNDLLDLEYDIPGTSINVFEYLPGIILIPTAIASERWRGVYNKVDIYYNLGGIFLGVAVRI